MPTKPTIIHFIYSLGRGGAETMLVSVIRKAKDYNNIVVYLYDDNKFSDRLGDVKTYCLKMRSVFMLPVIFLRFRKIVLANKADIVHSHLFWPTVVARFSTPRRIPVLTTIHTFIGYSRDYKKWYIRFIEKFSYRLRRNTIIGVCDGALKQYFSFLKLKPYRSYRLYTFVDTAVFNNNDQPLPVAGHTFKVFTIGTLHYPKNQAYLIKAFALLKDYNIELHIFGDGVQRKEFEQLIASTGANVVLKGDVADLQNHIHQYHLYVMASIFEGFSLSVLEAMAMRMPLLLSDIPSFREQCDDVALYFDLDNVENFVEKIKTLAADASLLEKMGAASKQRVDQYFTLDHHMAGLRSIYSEAGSQQA
jgi:glycosyltransferase involved in cell wall biosynthesis